MSQRKFPQFRKIRLVGTFALPLALGLASANSEACRAPIAGDLSPQILEKQFLVSRAASPIPPASAGHLLSLTRTP